MFTTAIIGFREFLEIFLIIGVFLGVSKKMSLKKELEIILAAVIGIIFSFFLIIATYFFGDHARSILTEKNADILESYLLIFSGVFIAYVIFSLHKMIGDNRDHIIKEAHQKLEQKIFDVSLFLTIIFLVIREGFEIALFSATISLFATFIENIIGLILGFLTSSILGISTFFAYIKMPMNKIFKYTEYGIILVGASFMENGITKLFQTHFNIDLSNMISFHFFFLPAEDTFIGNFLQSFFGVDNKFSLMRLAIMVAYAGIVYKVFLKRKSSMEIRQKSV